MTNEELKQTLGDDLCDYCRGNKAKSTIYAIVFARVYIAMMRWMLSWMKTKIILMMMRNK